MRLSKVNKNDLFRCITTAGLDPAQFQWKSDERTTELHHIEGYFVEFSESTWESGDYALKVWPGPDGPEDEFLSLDWTQVRSAFFEWAQRVKVEVDGSKSKSITSTSGLPCELNNV